MAHGCGSAPVCVPACLVDKIGTATINGSWLIADSSWLVCYWLEKMKVFNTHYLGVIKKSHSVWELKHG